MTVDSEQEKASMRAKLRSEKILERTLESIKFDKKNAAMDIKKSQNEMKKKLRKLKDRQRDIQKSKLSTQKPPESVEDFLANQFQARNIIRPKTSVPLSLKNKISGLRRPRPTNGTGAETNQNDYTNVDPSFFTDQRKSKIDLRPRTAIQRNNNTFTKLEPKGRLGSPAEELKYFDEDEISDRGAFYQQLVLLRKRNELDNFDVIENKVGQFLGQSDEQINRRQQQTHFLRQTKDHIISPKKAPMWKPLIDSSIKATRPHSTRYDNRQRSFARQGSQRVFTATEKNFARNSQRAFSAVQKSTSRINSSRGKSYAKVRPMSHK